MRTFCLMISIFTMIALFGCATKAEVRKIGKNRHEITAQGTVTKTPDEAFANKAKEACPNGYKVIERATSTKMSALIPVVTGTIECE